MVRAKTVLVRLLMTGVCLGATVPAPSFAQSPAPRVQPRTDDTVRARADALIARMTPEEKAGQLTTTFALPLPQMKDGLTKSAEKGQGSFLFVTDPKETNRLQRIAMETSRLKIPILFGFDVIHGLTTIFPVPIAGAASWDPALVERNQAIAAQEARAVGIHWTFAPMVDIARDPRWGRMVEGAGEDPYLGAAMAAAQVRGFQGPVPGGPEHIIAGPKHFAGYGAALGGRDYDEVNLSDSELWNVYLPPFKAAIDAGAGNIMSAYMGVNGVPAAANHWLLTDVLRGQWGFKGWVVSDNEAVNNLKTHGLTTNRTDSAARALQAGLDMEMSLLGGSYAKLPQAMQSGALTQRQLDDAVRRVLEAKIRLGLFEHPYVDEAKAAKTLQDPEHLNAARIAAERSAVLLRNDGGLLPLDQTKLRSVAVIGPLADAAQDALGPWVFKQNAPPSQSILSGLQDKLGRRVTVTFTPGVKIPPRLYPSPFAMITGEVKRSEPVDDDEGIQQAVTAARSSDLSIVVLGETQDMIGETASTSSLDLPGRQQDLLDAVIATGKPVVVLLMNGRPLDLKDSKPGAILDIWYPGSAGGAAAANLVFGDAVPGGKLPFTWPRNAGQVPLYYAHLASHDPAGADKRYWNESGAPVYPFGYGLSYSRFSYSNLKIDQTKIAPGEAVTVSVDLKNDGTRTADEVAQLYIHQRSGAAARPVRELKGFQRVTLKPGETRKLTFQLTPAQLRYWNAAKRDWVQDESEFQVAVGSDSTVAFTANFSVAAP